MSRSLAFLICAALPATVLAQPPVEPAPTEPAPTGTPPPEVEIEVVPAPTQPPPPSPVPEAPKPDTAAVTPASRIVTQAGVGSVAFATKGVLQLGGSAGLRAGSETTQVSFTPQVGWFLFDNFQISAIFDVTHLANDMAEDITTVAGLIEPSYHYPFTNQFFVFGGLGLGATWDTEQGGALALAPRIGVEFLIGRSGILTPSIAYLGTTEDEMLASDALRIAFGYSVMW